MHMYSTLRVSAITVIMLTIPLSGCLKNTEFVNGDENIDVNDDNVRGGELMVDAGKKDMTKYHKEVMKKFRPKVMTQESYAPDEGTPEARKKATKMTPGQEGVMDFLKRAGRKVMGNKPTASNVRKRINTNRGSTSGQQNSIANRINFGGKFSK